MSGLDNIRAVSFDVGGTLIEPWPSVGHVYAAVAAESGMGEIDPGLLNQRFKSVWSECPGFDYSRAGWEQLVQRVFQGITSSVPETLFPRLYDRFSEPHVWRVFEDVMPVVQSLSERKIRLAVISNWDERLRILLKTLGLEPVLRSAGDFLRSWLSETVSGDFRPDGRQPATRSLLHSSCGGQL